MRIPGSEVARSPREESSGAVQDMAKRGVMIGWTKGWAVPAAACLQRDAGRVLIYEMRSLVAFTDSPGDDSM
jgi:hypothetical protein